MKLSEKLGSYTIDIEQAKTYVSTWFKPEDLITLSASQVGTRHPKSFSMTAEEFFVGGSNDELESIIFEDGKCSDLYVNVCPVLEAAKDKKRGGEKNVAYIPGLYADIDVKNSGFEGTQDIYDYLKTLALMPTMIVGSPSGGVHVYWKFAEGAVGSKELLDRWWSYLDEMAGERSIDKLIDTARMLRVPGSVYFPKDGSGMKIGNVGLWYVNPENVVTPEQVMEISGDAYMVKCRKRKKMNDIDYKRRTSVDITGTIIDNGFKNKWQMMAAIANLEGDINEETDWAEILEPHGWSFLRTNHDDSRVWARPGRNERSAVTDYDDSVVMSLLSVADETGLRDLKESGINLTKYRVMLRLKYEDDEQAMINDILKSITGEV